jgi:hypothetical protein
VFLAYQSRKLARFYNRYILLIKTIADHACWVQWLDPELGRFFRKNRSLGVS